MQWLKQSTAATVKMGPFVDEDDGKTAETGLTIAQADIRLSKNGGDEAQTSNSAGATHDEAGDYGVPLDTTDTGTLGRLRVRIHVSGALPVWDEFMVLPANVWDSLFGADKLQVHAAEITNDLITAAAIATDAIDADALKADAVTEIVAGLAGALWFLDGTTTLQVALRKILAMAAGDTVVAGNANAVKGTDGNTLFTATLAASGRTIT